MTALTAVRISGKGDNPSLKVEEVAVPAPAKKAAAKKPAAKKTAAKKPAAKKATAAKKPAARARRDRGTRRRHRDVGVLQQNIADRGPPQKRAARGLVVRSPH